MFRRFSLILLVLAFLSGGCRVVVPGQEDDDDVIVVPEREDDENDEDDNGDENSSGTGKDDDVSTDDSGEGTVDESLFTDNIDIVWNGTGVTVTNKTGLSVTKEGAHVTVGTSSSEGKTIRINLSGKTSDGSIKVYNKGKDLLLSFNGVEITSSKSPAVNVQSAESVSVLLSEGSSNYLCDAANYSGIPSSEDAKGAFFSEKKTSFSGSGTLTVEGKGKHAIAVDNHMTFKGGKVIVKSAATDGIHSGDYVRIDGGTLDVTSSGEGIQCEGAEEGYFYMTGGNVTVRTDGEKSGGIETAVDIIIEGGNLDVTTSGAASKCLKSDNNITVSGGVLNLQTSGTGVYDSAARDAVACACIKAENNVVLKGGTITCKSSGSGGKGINCYKFECNDPAVLDVTTTGAKYSYSSQSCSPKAIKASGGVVVNGGSITVLTTGTEGEGLESKTTIEINGGSIAIQAKDDGINAASTITFKGGYTYAYSTGNDGIDSNYGRSGAIVVDGGVVIAHSANSPEEGFDADNHTYLTFKSGYVFCTGGQQGGGGGGWPGGGWRPGGGGSTGGSTASGPSCSQPTYLWNKAASVGYFNLADSSGKIVMSCYVPRSISSNYSFVSAPMTTGASYKYGLTSSAPTGATEVFGTYFYSDGTPSSTLSTSFTAGSGYVGNL